VLSDPRSGRANRFRSVSARGQHRRKTTVTTPPLRQEASELRVVLDKTAALAYERMAEALRADGFVKLVPSKLSSFIIQVFFQNYFETDKELLLSEFFDSKAYVENELKRAGDSSKVGEILERSMLKVRRMQEIKQRGAKKIGRTRKSNAS
jgi:hypothetical protein